MGDSDKPRVVIQIRFIYFLYFNHLSLSLSRYVPNAMVKYWWASVGDGTTSSVIAGSEVVTLNTSALVWRVCRGLRAYVCMHARV